MYQADGVLVPKPPFDLLKTLAFLAEFTPTRRDQLIARQSLTRAIVAAGRTVVFRVRSTGGVEAPQLAYTLYCERRLTPKVVDASLDRIHFFLSLDDDLRPFYAIAQADAHFRPVLVRLYGYHHVKFPTPFEAACWAMLSQHTRMFIARRARAMLVDRYGTALEVEGQRYPAFPAPDVLAQCRVDELAALVHNPRKAKYLHAAAVSFGRVDEDWLRTAPYDQIETWLRAIDGIGPWSAAFVLLRGLGRAERLSLGEGVLPAAVSKLYGDGRMLDARELDAHAARYGEWQGYWAHYVRAAV